MGVASPPAAAAPRERVRLTVRGTVQGVGFRPFVYRSARAFGIGGSVANTTAGRHDRGRGGARGARRFRSRHQARTAPAGARRRDRGAGACAERRNGFRDRAERRGGARSATVLPDLSTCQDCLREVFDPGNRRYRYPFTNCTHCGPRYSIIEDLPYDRVAHVDAPLPDVRGLPGRIRRSGGPALPRRAECLPGLRAEFDAMGWEGRPVAVRDAALLAAAAAIREGAVVAVKGLGGFHLMADARNEVAVGRLRARKLREEKPFAVMFPSLAAIEAECDLSAEEGALLTAPQRPIVLVRRKAPRASHGGSTDAAIADLVAPGNPGIGAMLPYTPLHHLLLADARFPGRGDQRQPLRGADRRRRGGGRGTARRDRRHVPRP